MVLPQFNPACTIHVEPIFDEFQVAIVDNVLLNGDELVEFAARTIDTFRVNMANNYPGPELVLPPAVVDVARPGHHYKFDVTGADGRTVRKADPMARRTERPPSDASVVPAAERFEWGDDDRSGVCGGRAVAIALGDGQFRLHRIEIADLGETARLVLGAVATIGRDANHDLLTSVVDVAGPELEAALRSVVDARLLVVDNEAYRFRHPLLGEVVYADLLPPQRARLHRRVAATLQQQTTDALRRADRAGELAFHLDHAASTSPA